MPSLCFIGILSALHYLSGIHVVFSLVLIMKQHSYAFYNGYLNKHYRLLPKLEAEFSEMNRRIDKGEAVTETEREERDALEKQIENTRKELLGGSEQLRYPYNLTFSNFADYMLIPTLVYELQYPRTKGFGNPSVQSHPVHRFRIRWTYILEKVFSTFGVMAIMILIVEEFIFPQLPTVTGLESTSEKFGLLGWLVLDLMPPSVSPVT